QLPCHDGQDEPDLCAVLRTPTDALDWVPDISPLAQRILRRCWPCPVTFLFETKLDKGMGSRLPEPVRRRLCGNGTLSLCPPGHAALLQTLRLFPGPALVAGARLLNAT